MNSIVFHARRDKEDQNPVFTVRFGAKKDFGNVDILFCVVSKPHPRLETYCKKTGYQITEDRLACLETEYYNGKRQLITVLNEKGLRPFLPRGTTKTLSFYADKAKRYFKTTDPVVVIRGNSLSWMPRDTRMQALKKPVILMAKLAAL